MDDEKDCIDEKLIDLLLVYKNQGHTLALLQLLGADTYQFLVGVANCPLCEVVHYCAGSNRTCYMA